MHYEPNVKRQRQLDTSTFKNGDSILFCGKCDWQAVSVCAMKPFCPECGEGLSVTTMSDELMELTNDK